MSQPVILSDELVFDASLAAQVAERSIAGQIELWAHLGRAIEPLLDAAQGIDARGIGPAQSLSMSLGSVDSSDGRNRLSAYLESRPFPHYEQAAEGPNLLIRVEQDGSRTLGRFVGREFRTFP